MPRAAFVRPLLRAGVYLNLHVGAIAWLILNLAAKQAAVAVPLPLQGLVVFGALAVYGLDRMGTASPEDVFNHPERTAWLRRHRTWARILVTLALAGLLLCWVFSPPHTRLGTLIFIPLAIAYAKPLPFLQQRLQDLPGLKLPFIVLAWTAFPLLHSKIIPDMDYGIWSLHLLFLLTGNVLWSEWHDAPGDAQSQGTPPGRFQNLHFVRTLTRATLLTSVILQAVPTPQIGILAPSFFLFSQECHLRKHPKTFARWTDLYLLVSLTIVWRFSN